MAVNDAPAVGMDVEVMPVSPEDKAFIDAEARRCQTSAAEILHRAILAYRSEPELPDLPDLKHLKGRTMLDYFEPIDIEDSEVEEMTAKLEASFAPLDVPDDGITDGSVNHDRYA